MKQQPFPSILLADDEQGMRDLYHFTLEPLGYEVVTVSDGLAALEAVIARAFDLVVLDVHMPQMSGVEALKRIRKSRPIQRILVVTTPSGMGQSIRAPGRDPDIRCLYKPLSVDELTTAVEHALAERV